MISSMCIMLIIGIIYLWSIFREPVVEYFGWSRDAASLIVSMMLPMNIIGIMTGGFLNDRKGPVLVLRLGACSAALGMLLTSFVPKGHGSLIYFTYAVMVGFGAGLINNTCLSMVQKWWCDARGMAVGLNNSAYAMSSVVMAPLINKLLKTGLGVPGTFRVLAAILVVVMLTAGRNIKMPPEGWIRETGAGNRKDNSGKLVQYRPRDVIRSPKYYLLVACIVCVSCGYLMLNSSFKAYGISKGLTEAMAVSVVMVSGIGSAAGRLLMSSLTDRFRSTSLLVVTYCVEIACLVALVFTGGIGYMVCIAGLSFAYGASSSLTSAINVSSFGSKYLSSNYGLVTMGVLISGLLSPTLSVALSQGGLPSNTTLFVGVGLGLTGICLAMFLAALNKKDAI